MSTITVRFTASKSIACHIIRWLTWSEYSHVEFKTSTGYVGALPEGVVWKPRQYDPHCNYALAHITVTPQELVKINEFLKAQIGKPYDFGAIVGIWLHRDWSHPGKWFCSELVAATFRAAGIKLVGDMEMKDRITPRDLLYSPLVHIYEVHQE